MIDPHADQRYFEDVRIGDEFDEQRTATPEQVNAFFARNPSPGVSRLSQDGRFSNAEDARRAGLERPIVPGPMSAAIVTSMVSDWMGAFGRIVSIDVSFRRPILQGDSVRCVAVVTDIGQDALGPAAPGIVSLDVHMESADGERPLQGTAVVELPRRE